MVDRFWAFLALMAVLAASGTDGYKGKPRGIVFTKLNNSSTRIGEQTTDVFPDAMDFGMMMEGVGNVELHLVRDRFMNPPHMWANAGANTVDIGDLTKKTSFYTDASGYGSFACVADSNSDCVLAALLDMGDEICYIAPGSSEADCTVTEDGGVLELYEELSDGGRRLVDTANIEGGNANSRKRRSTNGELPNRKKRSIFPTIGYQVVEIAYIGDKSFMQSFYDRYPGNNVAAQEEAALFVALMTNEMNVYYASIKDVSGGKLDLYLYPADMIFPEAGSDFAFIEKAYDGTYLNSYGDLDSEIATYINNGLTDKSWDHAFVMTGYNIYGSSSGTLAYAYLSTVCSTYTYKFSLNEYRSYNMARIGAHEIGHALAMYHDSSTECPGGTNIMSAWIFSITSDVLDTYYKFSQCSVDQVVAHLENNPDCTNQHGFTEAQFKASFCSGFPGAQDGWLDMQCQKQTGWSGSTPCNTPENDRDCYYPYEISCRTEQNTCSSIRYVWQGTSCGTDKFCYRGRCVDSFEICDAQNTTTTSKPSTTTSATTARTTSTTARTTSTTPYVTTTSSCNCDCTTCCGSTTRYTTTPTTTTTTPTTTTTTQEPDPTAPCTCCGIKGKKKFRKCCKKGLRIHGTACYCCAELENTNPPKGWKGPKY